MATKREYRRMEVAEEGEELDEAEWAHRAEAQRQRRGRGQRYAFSCALFASLNGILLGYGQSMFPLHAPPAWTANCHRFLSEGEGRNSIFLRAGSLGFNE
ncbi:unnamed protein product [Miscanthus lutarioriparius]|uniref:Uncharacterized protein n=1 Tax=Miscanthus lutarioriparius TaxID=422564 RepID=A0A811QMH6_9POAL|nr:unnamed protein product [Miscanthus lutarioriparius]